MSASSAQQTVEKKESVKDVKPMKPPIKPKPFVPPKPKQAFISTNSDIKSPSLSPNSGGPCSPSFDIPSAFKISQLTGPQPYGTRRTSLRRWSSSVGEEVPPESETLLSPVENAVPELSTKVTTQSLAPVKPLQTGSVWKGKSPFMLTTRGWGEQRSQVKDFHESESFSLKHSFSSGTKDADLKEKEAVLEGNMVINSGSHSRSKSEMDHEGVNTNVKDQKQSLSKASEEVEKTVFGAMSSGKLQKLEIPAKDDEVKESSSQLSGSAQTDLCVETTKQSTQYEDNKQDSKTESFSYKSDHKTTGSPENIDVASIQVKNASLRTKDYGELHQISLVPTTMPKADILFTENTKNSQIIEKSPLSDTSSSTVYRYHEDRIKDIPELRTVMREEQEADSGYLEAPLTEIMVTNQNTEQSSLGKLEQVEKHDISSVAQIIDKPETKMYTNFPHEDKESTVSMEHNILSTAEHYNLHEGILQVASDNNNTPYSDQGDKKIVAQTDMQSPMCTVRPNDLFSDKSENTSTHVQECNIEEEQDELKNRMHEYDDTTQTGEYVPHKASDGFEKQTENPSEYRSIFGNNARSTHESETNSAPELDRHADDEASTNLHVGSQILENYSLVPGEVYSHPVNESDKSLHSYMETETQSSKPHEELSQSENYESSRPESHYDESQYRYSEATSQDPADRVTKPENVQSDRLVYTTAQSPVLKESEVHLDKIEHRYDESNKLQHIHSQSQEQECNHGHKVELDNKQSEVPVCTYEQSEEPEYIYQHLEKSAYKFEMPDKPSVVCEQLEEPVEFSKEPVYTYDEQSHERVSTYKQSEGSGLKSEETEELGYRSQKVEHSIHKHDLLEEPSHKCETSEETVHRDDLSEDSVHEHKQSDNPTGRYEKTEELALQQPKTVVHNDLQSEEPEEAEKVQKYGHLKDPLNKYEPSEESEHKYEQLEDTVHKYEQLEDTVHKYEQLEDTVHKYEQLEDIVHKYEQLEDPVHKYEQLDESTDRYEQTEQPVQGYQKSEESTHKYKMSKEPVNRDTQSEKIVHSHDQSLEPDYRYKQHDEPAHIYELAKQYEGIEDPAYIHTGSDATNSERSQSGLIDLESHQQQYKPVQLEEMDSTTSIPTLSSEVLVKSSEKDVRHSEYLEQQLRESYMEEAKYSDTSTDEMHASEKTEEQFHKYPLSEEQKLLGMHKEETQQWHAKSEEAQHVDGLSESSRQKLPTITTVESDDSMPDKTQDQNGQITYQIPNGHAEHGELQTVDYTSEAVKEINAEEPEETQAEEPPVENFDFLEGTVVLDTSFMRGKASLGKKRGHRTPAGTCASEEHPEYWMFRDSTEPKSLPERISDEEDKAEKSPGETPDETPENSPSPVKSPNKKGIFGGIISPSLLKGRLKTRSKTTEDETVRPEAEESKSPGKEKTETSSHSMNWLNALKKKRKSTKESNKEEKKKQPK